MPLLPRPPRSNGTQWPYPPPSLPILCALPGPRRIGPRGSCSTMMVHGAVMTSSTPGIEKGGWRRMRPCGGGGGAARLHNHTPPRGGGEPTFFKTQRTFHNKRAREDWGISKRQRATCQRGGGRPHSPPRNSIPRAAPWTVSRDRPIPPPAGRPQRPQRAGLKPFSLPASPRTATCICPPPQHPCLLPAAGGGGLPNAWAPEAPPPSPPLPRCRRAPLTHPPRRMNTI